MFIAKAYAAAAELNEETINEAINVAQDSAGKASAGNAFWFNMGLIAVMFIAFYIILIRPQQRRMEEQQKQLDGLKKGDKVVTAGGLIGKISKLTNDREVEVDLGGMKVNALRYTLQLDDSGDVEKMDKAKDAVKDSK